MLVWVLQSHRPGFEYCTRLGKSLNLFKPQFLQHKMGITPASWDQEGVDEKTLLESWPYENEGGLRGPVTARPS